MSKNILFSSTAWEDYQYWQKTDPKKIKKINKLIKSAIRDPFKGEGSPEPLKGNLTGSWSRRIDHEHRLVYIPTENQLQIQQCRYHYEK